jgi:hypothetical protein
VRSKFKINFQKGRVGLLETAQFSQTSVYEKDNAVENIKMEMVKSKNVLTTGNKLRRDFKFIKQK